MALVRSKDTAPELLVRKMLTALNVRYRLHRRDIPGRPDIYIARSLTAVFVHGCFWHQHDCKVGDRQPKTHTEYWLPKLRATVERDAKNKQNRSGRHQRNILVDVSDQLVPV